MEEKSKDYEDDKGGIMAGDIKPRKKAYRRLRRCFRGTGRLSVGCGVRM